MKTSAPFLQLAGTTCHIHIIDMNNRVHLNLTDVIFGDVWICSGQSNMEYQMAHIFNSSEEVAASLRYDQIRFMIASVVLSEGREMMDNKPNLSWSRPADEESLGKMSAVCFLFARHVFDATGVPQVSSHGLNKR